MDTTWIETPSGRLNVGKILCLVRNYRAHAEEFGEEVPPEPTFFLKPPTSIVHDGEEVIVPDTTSDLQVEAELGVVIGATTKEVSVESSYDYVFGYCVVLDITARDLQRKAMKEGLPWTLSKGMDTFAPLSNATPKEEVADPHALEILLKVNGKPKQRARTAQMIQKVPAVVASISSHMTLMKGDVIATGTPAGVPKVRAGDELEAEIEQVGRITVRVEGAS